MCLARYEGYEMGQRRRGRGSKYTDGFKRELVAESQADGVTVPMVSKRHGVPTSRIYSWRGDARFQSDGSAIDAFTPVEVADVLGEAVALPEHDMPSRIEVTPAPRVEITLENGRRLSVTDWVDAGFVLELARGLAA
jgi:transposase